MFSQATLPAAGILMIIGNRALWLARSFASSRYNHRAVIITLKASSFQNGSQICWCFGVGNWSIILFSRKIINVIILKHLVASGDLLLNNHRRWEIVRKINISLRGQMYRYTSKPERGLYLFYNPLINFFICNMLGGERKTKNKMWARVRMT